MSLRSKKILISGATGFIGANLVRRLLKTNSDLHLLVKPKSSNLWRIKDIINKLNIHEINIQNKNELQKAVFGIKPAIIFHLAAYGSYPWEENFERIFGTNVISTINLFRACCKVGFDSFINTGSSSEYGLHDKPMDEECKLSPITDYGSTKAAATMILEEAARREILNVVTIRPFSVYGPYENQRRLIPTLMIAAILGKGAKLALKKSVRDYVYVEDLIDAYLLAAAKSAQGIFNIGSGREYSNLEVFEIVKRISGGRLEDEWGKEAPRTYEAKHWVCDNTRAKKILGWKPKHDLEEGLLETYKWFKANVNRYS